MIRLFFIVSALLTFGNTQKLDHLFEQFERGEIKDVKGKIPILLKKHPNDPGVKYLFGLTLMDGDSAIEVYKEIINKHPSSKYSEGASSKIGQYLYSRGLYTQASQHLRKFIFRHPKSKDLSRMMGMFLRSFDATGELDSAQYFVDKYFRKHPKQHLIKNELGYIPDSIKRIKYYKEKIIKKDSKVVGTQGEQGNWMIQVGAFGNRNNAVNLKEKLTKGGYSVSINTLTSNKRSLFAVRVGPFKSRRSAKNKGQELNNLYRLDYQLLNLEK